MSMMVEANMPDSMWNEAYKIAGYIANRTHTKRLAQAAVPIDPDLTTYFHAFANSIRTSAAVERRTHIIELLKEPKT